MPKAKSKLPEIDLGLNFMGKYFLSLRHVETCMYQTERGAYEVHPENSWMQKHTWFSHVRTCNFDPLLPEVTNTCFSQHVYIESSRKAIWIN